MDGVRQQVFSKQRAAKINKEDVDPDDLPELTPGGFKEIVEEARQ